MGTVEIQAHTFFMAMYSTDVNWVGVRRGDGGARIAQLEGRLGCATYAALPDTTVGSPTSLEIASFEIVAVDGGRGGGSAGDSFAFTVLFDPVLAPVNHAIFGPRPTFTGTMVAG